MRFFSTVTGSVGVAIYPESKYLPEDAVTIRSTSWATSPVPITRMFFEKTADRLVIW